MKSIVLLSGGMDSTTALAQAIKQSDEVVALSLLYGSKHQASENGAAQMVVRHYGILREVIAMEPEVFAVPGGSALLEGGQEVPNEEYHDPEKESPSATVVPFRNANLISQAVAYAEAHGFDRVWVAVHASDAQGFAYPDCTPEFMGAMAAAVYVGTHRKVRLEVPFQWMTKAGIVQRAHSLGVPLQLTWSCYRGGKLHCGACPTCLERIKAFETAGFVDPVVYDAHITWPEGLQGWGAF